MPTSTDSPKIFVSYSWKPKTNKEMTLELAERLESEGVNVVIDVWNLAEGQDKYLFMEQMDRLLETKQLNIAFSKRLLQGPFSDVLTHGGQISMLQRIYENPIDWEDFSSSEIKTGLK